MVASIIQPSFGAGEISPTMYGRVDLAKFKVGAALLRNFFVDYRGGASNRPGTRWIQYAAHDDLTVRLYPFKFNVQQQYVLEFSHGIIRFYRNGGQILAASKTITGITQASPGVITSNAHGYTNGQWVFLNITAGMPQLNQRTFIVDGVTANTFYLRTIGDLIAVDTTAFGAFTSGVVSAVYQISTPYLHSDLFNLKFTQTEDVLTITHAGYQQHRLTRFADNNWTLTPISVAVATTAPAAPTLTATAAGTANYSYVTTVVSLDGEESLASPATQVASANLGTTANSITITSGVVSGIDYYNFYKSHVAIGASVPSGEQHGWIGSSFGNVFVDSNILPDFTKAPPRGDNPFTGPNKWPGVAATFQQRMVYAATYENPSTVWGSQVGLFNNFSKSLPTVDSDAYNFKLSSNEINHINSMIAMPGGLVVLTSGGAWQLSGGEQGSPITPARIKADPQAYNGCNEMPPIVVNYEIVYVQALGSSVRSLSYNFFANIYTGADMSVLSNHLFDTHTLVDWAYAEEPFKIIWVVRDDGKLLSFTFLKEQEVYAWAQHDTWGEVKSVCTIIEGSEHAVYFVVRRYANGRWRQYVERMMSRLRPSVEDAWFVDSGLESPMYFLQAWAGISPASGVAQLYSDVPVFAPGHVGMVVRLGGGRGTITGYVSTTLMNVTMDIPVQTVMPDGIVQNAAPGEWSLSWPVTVVGGLEHLNGRLVAILADGRVQPQQVVTNGTITLAAPASRVIVGMPYQCQFQTLNLDVGEPTIQGKRKKISGLTVKINKSRGLKYGLTFNTLSDFFVEDWIDTPGLPITVLSGEQYCVNDPMYSNIQQICLQQDHPLPVTVLAVVPDVDVGDVDQ